MKKFLLNIVIIFIASASLFSQEYEIAWEKDIGGSYAQFSKDGEFIYVSGGNTISKYHSSDGSFVSTFDNSGLPVLDITSNFYISNSGNYLITKSAINKTDGYIYFWDIKTEKAIKRLNIGYSDFIDESRMIITDYQHPATRLMKYDFISDKILLTKSYNENFNLVKVSHNGKMFATASFSLDGTKYYLTLWDIETLTEIKRFELVGNQKGTSFMDIKFAWDDKFVSIRRIAPYIISIFDVDKLISYKEVNSYMNIDVAGNEFLTNGDCVFYFPNPDISEYNLLIYDNSIQNLKQSFNLKAYNMVSSSNNLLFTAKYLLRTKTIGVTEPIQQNISITNLKDIIIIDNKSENNENVDIILYDLNGKEVFRFLLFINYGTNKLAIPKNILNGSYIIQITSKNLNISQKILIQI